MSRPSSELRFRALDGTPCEPREWTPLLLEVPGETENWPGWAATVNGEARPVSLRRLAGEALCVCEWPQSAAGHYRVAFEHPNREPELHRFFLPPAKLGAAALARLLEQLERRLPHALAAALEAGGALAGVDWRPPEDVSPAAELARLRHLVKGAPNAPGLLAVLRQVSADPYRVLSESLIDVAQDRVRRPHPVLLRQAVARGRQVDDDGRPLRLWDLRAEPSFDVYENRLLVLVLVVLRRRLVRLAPVLPSYRHAEVESLVGALDRARLEASFLDAVATPPTPPEQITQVLLHRAPYRRALDLWRGLTASLEVRLEADAVETPLQSVPDLYELWASLISLVAIVETLTEQGFRTTQQRLVRRRPEGPLVEMVRNQDPVLEGSHADGTAVRVYFQRSYSRTGFPFASLSFEQRPDLVVETRYADGAAALLILDPKYKIEERSGAFGPAKADIDKMHAYRDAIICRRQGRVVRHAAILYPGPAWVSDGGVSAISADPLDPDAIAAAIRALLENRDQS